MCWRRRGRCRCTCEVQSGKDQFCSIRASPLSFSDSLFLAVRALTITTSRPHALPNRPVELSSYLELFPYLETLSIDWTYCLAGTDASLDYQEVMIANISSTSLGHLVIRLKPYLIVTASSGKAIAHPVSRFRTSLEMRNILEHLVLPNLESLTIHAVWNPSPPATGIPRDFAELANCTRCLRRFATLVDVSFTIENKQELVPLIGAGYTVRIRYPIAAKEDTNTDLYVFD
jgi:hypothetical protein